MELTLADFQDHVETFDYPLAREEAAAACSDVTLLLADGEANLGELLADGGRDRFGSPDDFVTAVQNALPREAVGEPFQSEGEG